MRTRRSSGDRRSSVRTLFGVALLTATAAAATLATPMGPAASPAPQNTASGDQWTSYRTPGGHFEISYIVQTSRPFGSTLPRPLWDAEYLRLSTWPASFRVRPSIYGSGTPIYIQDLGAFLEESLSRIRALRFDVPADFRGVVRVQDLGTKDGQTSGGNGSIVIDNDMKHSSETNVGQLLMRTAAHELFHALQITSGWRSMPRWFMEASAAYVEYRVWEPELGASTLKGYLETGGRFPNTALEDSDEDHSYSAAAFLVYLQDTLPRAAPDQTVDFVAEMFGLGGSLADQWKGTTDTDYVGYVASTVAARRGYTVQVGTLPSSSTGSSGVSGLLALVSSSLQAAAAPSRTVSMAALWQLFNRAYFVEWSRWARPRAWFGTNAALYDQIADRLDVGRAVEKDFSADWLPLTARLAVVDGENFRSLGGAAAQRGATVVVRLDALDPAAGNTQFQPLFFVYAKNAAGTIVGGASISPASPAVAYAIGVGTAALTTVEILGMKGPVGWMTGRLAHRSSIHAYALLPPQAATYTLMANTGRPDRQALTLSWTAPPRAPDLARTGLRYRVCESASATSHGAGTDVPWTTTRLDVTKDPGARVFYHVVTADNDGHESPAAVVEVPPATVIPAAAGSSLETAVRSALQTLGYTWQPFEQRGNEMVEPTRPGGYLTCSSRDEQGLVTARCVFRFLAVPREAVQNDASGRPAGRTLDDGWGFDARISAVIDSDFLTQFAKLDSDPQTQAQLQNGEVFRNWGQAYLKAHPGAQLSQAEALALFTGRSGPLRRQGGVLGYVIASDQLQPWDWFSTRQVNYIAVDRLAAALAADPAALQRVADHVKQQSDDIPGLRKTLNTWPPFGNSLSLKVAREARCGDGAVQAWVDRQPSPYLDPARVPKTLCPPYTNLAEPAREAGVLMDALIKAGLASPLSSGAKRP